MTPKELRAQTGAGIVACFKALKETGGDPAKAVALLKERGEARAESYVGRETQHGVVGSYVHHDLRSGAMVVLACETDFVARTPEFQELANNLAMHSVASFTQTPEELTGQPFILDPTRTVDEVVKGFSSKCGERVVVKSLVQART